MNATKRTSTPREFVGVANVYCMKCRDRRSFEIFLLRLNAEDGTVRELSDRKALGYCLLCNEPSEGFRIIVAAARLAKSYSG